MEQEKKDIWAEIDNSREVTDPIDPWQDSILAMTNIDAYEESYDDNPDEPRQVIARVFLTEHGDVLTDYIDERAAKDGYAQQMIREVIRDYHSESDAILKKEIEIEEPEQETRSTKWERKDTPAEPPKDKKKIMIIAAIVAGVIVLGLGGFFGFRYMHQRANEVEEVDYSSGTEEAGQIGDSMEPSAFGADETESLSDGEDVSSTESSSEEGAVTGDLEG